MTDLHLKISLFCYIVEVGIWQYVGLAPLLPSQRVGIPLPGVHGPGGVHGPRGVHGPGCVHGPGWVHGPGGWVHGPGRLVSQHALRQIPPPGRERRLLLRTIRILLECILVL